VCHLAPHISPRCTAVHLFSRPAGHAAAQGDVHGGRRCEADLAGKLQRANWLGSSQNKVIASFLLDLQHL
jgi:hypothetical protein